MALPVNTVKWDHLLHHEKPIEQCTGGGGIIGIIITRYTHNVLLNVWPRRR